MNFTKTFQNILRARGIDIIQFNRDELNHELIQSVPEFQRVLELFKQALSAKCRITICADYDCDGITAAAQFVRVLETLGHEAQVLFPNRYEEGYGLNDRMLDYAAQRSTDLLICLDFGISSLDLLRKAKSLGIETMVLDHHETQNLTPSVATELNILVPKMLGDQFRYLCASGLTFFFLNDLCRTNSDLYRELIELATVGTICDMVPLVDVNRALVRIGLNRLQDPVNVGLAALADLERPSTLTFRHIAFSVGPKLNAAGRIDDPSISLQILTTQDVKEATSLALVLTEINDKRKNEQRIGTDIALNSISKLDKPAYAIFDKRFDLGVVGLIAQKIVEHTGKPAAVATTDRAGVAKGSARSPSRYNCYEALAKCQKMLAKFGGHKQAGGFSLLSPCLFQDFSRKWEEHFSQIVGDTVIEFDTELLPEDFGLTLVREIKLLEPFGVGNARPRLLLKDCQINNCKMTSSFSSFMVSFGGKISRAKCFERTQFMKIARGGAKNMIATLDEENTKGFTEPVLIVKEVFE